MTRTLCLLFTLVLLLGATPLAAQEDTYVIQKGDNLWNLAGAHLDDAKLWEQIFKDNSFLQEPGRRFQKDGIVYVMVRPGEKLVGLEKVGIMATLTSIDRLQLPQQTAVYEVPTTPAWVWWTLLVLAVLAILFWLANRHLNQDAATSGSPVVPNGVTAQTAGVHFQQIAAFRAGNSEEASTRLNVYQDFTVLEQTAGRIWGVLNVSYADGRSVPRRLNGERAFRARVRFPSGHEETLYMLQACGNDLRYGGISRYLPGPEFRFEADPIVAPVATPEPAPQPEPAPEPAPQPATEPETIPPAPAAEVVTPQPAKPVWEPGVVKFELRKATDGKGAMGKFMGVDETEDLTFESEPGMVTIRFRPKQ